MTCLYNGAPGDQSLLDWYNGQPYPMRLPRESIWRGWAVGEVPRSSDRPVPEVHQHEPWVRAFIHTKQCPPTTHRPVLTIRYRCRSENVLNSRLTNRQATQQMNYRTRRPGKHQDLQCDPCMHRPIGVEARDWTESQKTSRKQKA